MTQPRGRAVTRAEISHVIVRACTECGHPRQLGADCAGCGNTATPLTHDLGVQSATYRNPLRRAWWRLVRQPAAARRARAANQHAHHA